MTSLALAQDTLALVELVAEGQLPWHEAALTLRQDHGLCLRGLTLCGATQRLQAADPEYQARRRRSLLRAPLNLKGASS